MRTAWRMFIAGKWVGSLRGKVFCVTEPATGKPLAEVPQGDAGDADLAVGAAAKAFESGPWPGLRPPERARILYQIAEGIRARAEEIARIESRNVGKPIRDSRDEVAGAAACFEYYAGAVTKHFGEVIPVTSPGLDFTLREPIGVCALIVPWNFPFIMAAWKVAPALATGNTVVLKPASWSPLSALLLGEVAEAAGLPPGVLNIVTGPGSTVGAALAAHPGVGKVAFTGETATGAQVMKGAADTIKKVSLELGGKSPNILFADADLEAAVDSSVYAVFGNCGQDCCARSRIFVERA
ncbi:MAG: aldehyde dehydrogenase family protein, partial [candidate division NC10 bacterium]|nr:aldehyde dehydrogenase family protein [candidate division NC10 bacterium]